MSKYTIYFFLFICCTIVLGQPAENTKTQIFQVNNKQEVDVTAINANSGNIFGEKKTPSWANSIFLTMGFGYPQGLNMELGYTLNEIISLGLTANFTDSWSKEQSTKPGILARIFVPISSTEFCPYILYKAGRRFGFFKNAQKYNLVFAGIMIPLQKKIFVRPEIGIVWTSQQLSGAGLFSNEPDRYKDETFPGVNITFEILF